MDELFWQLMSSALTQNANANSDNDLLNKYLTGQPGQVGVGADANASADKTVNDLLSIYSVGPNANAPDSISDNDLLSKYLTATNAPSAAQGINYEAIAQSLGQSQSPSLQSLLSSSNAQALPSMSSLSQNAQPHAGIIDPKSYKKNNTANASSAAGDGSSSPAYQRLQAIFNVFSGLSGSSNSTAKTSSQAGKF